MIEKSVSCPSFSYALMIIGLCSLQLLGWVVDCNMVVAFVVAFLAVKLADMIYRAGYEKGREHEIVRDN